MAKLRSLPISSSTSTLLLQSTHDSLRTCGTKRDRARTTGAHSFLLQKDSLFRDPRRKHSSEHRKKPSPSNPKVATRPPDSPRLHKTSITASSYRDPVNWKIMLVSGLKVDYGIIICGLEAAHGPVRVPGIVGWQFGVRWRTRRTAPANLAVKDMAEPKKQRRQLKRRDAVLSRVPKPPTSVRSGPTGHHAHVGRHCSCLTSRRLGWDPPLGYLVLPCGFAVRPTPPASRPRREEEIVRLLPYIFIFLPSIPAVLWSRSNGPQHTDSIPAVLWSRSNGPQHTDSIPLIVTI
ncbi:hypothetical protein BHE74_00051898 [Ensete ventricosum]|nr:hypothetical protein BHE74_00051898 [Ensete ventricosum]RZS23038.1 hypothetical protein BHM03_00055874 [Ensete ventricosum]